MRPLPIDEKGGVLVVNVGENAFLNDGQAFGIRQGLYEAVAARPLVRVAIDLSGVDYISSTGIALLIGTKRRVDSVRGQLVLFGVHPDILDLFHSMKLNALFEIAHDEAEALALLPSPPTS